MSNPNAYWLLKSEPDEFSIDDLAANPGQTTHWDGVRNYQARNFLRDSVKKGDLCFFYHSNASPACVAGICRVTREGYPDHTAFDPTSPHFDPKADPAKPAWFMVEVKLIKKFRTPVSIDRMRSNPVLKEMQLLARGNRLSVLPVRQAEWDAICAMAE